MSRLFLVFPLVLAACAGGADLPQRRSVVINDLPPMKTFAPRTYAQPKKSNATLARDFLELSFAMESGRELPVLTRFETPITVRVTGHPRPANLDRDLDALLVRLRREAKVEITRVPPEDELASISIETVPRKALQRLVPQAACFVVPNATSWEDFRKLRRSGALDWARLETRTTAAIFIPGDVAPQEVRDCLHEELAQAIGPLNDLYRLPDSVFNDDNFHTVLTGFDMLMVRATYSPQLKSGMTKAEVAPRLPGILAAIHPAGRNGGIAAPIETPREWIDAIETALGPHTSDSRRARAAHRALVIAQTHGWEDTRMAFSLFVVARLALADEGDLALASFFKAAALYSESSDTALQAAHVGMQLAAFALSSGDPAAAIDIINHHLPVVARSENAALLATFLLIKAEALDMENRGNEAAAVRTEGLGWARYGFGSDRQVAYRLDEIASLRPRRPRPAS